MNLKIKIVNNFVKTFYSSSNSKSTAFMNFSSYHYGGDIRNETIIASIFGDLSSVKPTIFNKNKFSFTNYEKFSKQLDAISAKYDLVIGEFPFNMLPSIKIDKNHMSLDKGLIFKSLSLLSNEGFALFALPPNLSFSLKGKKFMQFLNDNGYYLNGIINCPNQILEPLSFGIYVAIISKINSKFLFIADTNGESGFNDSKEIVLNFFQMKDIKNLQSEELLSQNINNGVLTDKLNFKSFESYKTSLEVQGLLKYYKDFTVYGLKHVLKKSENGSKSIILPKTGDKHSHKENAIYFPKIGTHDVVSDLDMVKNKHQNFYQIVLDEAKIKNTYAASFFNSELGIKIRKTLTLGTYIPTISLAAIEKLEFPVPPIKIQENISEAYIKIKLLIKNLSSFNQEISINPNSVNNILENINKMLDQLDKLSDSDKIIALLRNGETRICEFKETLSLCIKEKQKKSYLEDMVFKTINGFLNSSGGDLLIGVDDYSNLVGLKEEIKKLHKNSVDEFKKHFKNKLKARIGEQFYPIIESKMVNVDGKLIFRVKCQKSDTPSYLDGKDFYVRTDPATDKLEGPKLVEYIQKNF